MRPRESWTSFQAVQFFFAHKWDLNLAYGNYNNLVLDAAGIRGQSVILWDFEWVDYLLCCSYPPIVNCANNLFSSRDSLGASPQTSKNLYNNIANQHPSTILALNHETIGSFASVHPYF